MNTQRKKKPRTGVIRVTPETRQRLRFYGRKGETYNDAINRLLDEVWKHERKRK